MAKSVHWRYSAVRPEVFLVALGCLVLIGLGMGKHAVLLGFGIAGAFWIARYPVCALLLVLAMVPFGQYVGDLHWLISAMICGVVGVHCLANRRWPEKANASLWIWIVGFLLVNIIATLASPYPDQARENLVKLSLGYAFVALVMVLVNSRAFRHGVPLVVAGSITICALLAVYGYYFESAYFASNIDQFKRGTGATVSPVSLSIMIIYVLPFLAYYFFTRKAEKSLVALGCIAVAVAGMTTTLSRGGFLLLLFMSAAIAFEYLRGISVRNFLFGAMCTVIVVWCAVLFIPGKYWERQQSLTDETNGSVNRRVAYLLVGAGAFEQRPVFGHGTYAFKEIYGGSNVALEHASTRELQEGRLARYAHNTYMEVLVGSGLLGLALFLGINWCAWQSYTAAKRMFAAQGRPREARLVAAYRLAYLGLLLYLLIQSDLMHKYLLLSLAMSQVALREARLGEQNQSDNESYAVV